MNKKHLLISILLMALSQTVLADSTARIGKSFSNPDKTMQMPAGWISKPVSYNKKIHAADLVITFGQQTYPALHKLVEQYATDNNLKIIIQSGTCGISAGKLLRKSLDSGTFCCPPGAKDRLPGLEFHTIAISALAVFVNEKNPVENITTKQAQRIFQGKIRNWGEVGADKNSVRSSVLRHAYTVKNAPAIGPYC